MCNTQAGLAGANCNDICSQGQMLLAMNIIVTVFGLSIAAVCIYLGYHQFKYNSEPVSYPILFTMICTGVGSLCFGIEGIIAAANTVGFRTFSVVTELSTGQRIRRSPEALDETTFLMFGIAACFGTCSLFVLPLSWVSSDLCNQYSFRYN